MPGLDKSLVIPRNDYVQINGEQRTLRGGNDARKFRALRNKMLALRADLTMILRPTKSDKYLRMAWVSRKYSKCGRLHESRCQLTEHTIRFLQLMNSVFMSSKIQKSLGHTINNYP